MSFTSQSARLNTDLFQATKHKQASMYLEKRGILAALLNAPLLPIIERGTNVDCIQVCKLFHLPILHNLFYGTSPTRLQKFTLQTQSSPIKLFAIFTHGVIHRAIGTRLKKIIHEFTPSFRELRLTKKGSSASLSGHGFDERTHQAHQEKHL
jgi:hypothetical protein